MIADAAKHALKSLVRLAEVSILAICGVVVFFILIFIGNIMVYLTAYVSDSTLELIRYIFEG